MKMRKILSFVLVLALVLGSFSMAFAQTPFADVNGTPNEEAVEVLVGLGIINGYPDGTFKPDNIVTRAEMAKILIVALGLEDYATGTSKFPDMAGAGWAQGYVNYAAGLGIIIGYPDGTFKPSQTVSYDEASAMIVRALGYTDASLLPATWPANYVVKAKALGILEGVKSSVLGANRGDIAEMVYNALTLDMGSVDAENKWYANSTDEDAPDNILVRLGAEFNSAAVVYGTEETKINLVPYTGMYAETYTMDDEIVAVALASDKIVGGYEATVGTTGAGIVNASTADDTDYTVTAAVAGIEVPYFWNGVEEPTSTRHPYYSIDTMTTATGGDSTLSVDLSGKRIADVYAISYWQISASGLFSDDDADDIADDQELFGASFILDDNDDIDMNQFVIEGAANLDAIDEDAVVYVYDGWHAAGIKKIQVGTEVVTGKVTEQDGDTYTINGKEYDLAYNELPHKMANIDAPDAFKVGDTVTARLDYFGYIFDIEVESSTPDMYAVVLDSEAAGFDDARIKLFTSDDATKTFSVDEDLTLPADDKLVGYALDKDGMIDKFDLTAGTAPSAELRSATVLSANGTTYAVAKDVVVFTFDGADYDLTTIGKIETGMELTGDADLQMILDDGIVVAMVVDAEAAGATDDDTYAVINKIVTAIDADDEAIQKLTGFAAGTAMTKYTDADDTVTGYSDEVIALWNLEMDVDGVVTGAMEVTTEAAVYEVTIADLTADNTAVKVGTAWYAIADNAVVYEAEYDGGFEYSASSIASLDEGDTVTLFETDSDSDGYDVVVFEAN